MNRIEQIIKENNLNCEAALGRGKTHSGDLNTTTLRHENGGIRFSSKQLEVLKMFNLEPRKLQN